MEKRIESLIRKCRTLVASHGDYFISDTDNEHIKLYGLTEQEFVQMTEESRLSRLYWVTLTDIQYLLCFKQIPDYTLLDIDTSVSVSREQFEKKLTNHEDVSKDGFFYDFMVSKTQPFVIYTYSPSNAVETKHFVIGFNMLCKGVPKVINMLHLNDDDSSEESMRLRRLVGDYPIVIPKVRSGGDCGVHAVVLALLSYILLQKHDFI